MNYQQKIMLLCMLSLFPQHQLNSFDRNDKNLPTNLAVTALVSATAYATYVYTQQPAIPSIAIKDLSNEKSNFGNNFAWGISTSSTQCEEKPHTSACQNCWSQSYVKSIPGKEKTITPLHACFSWSEWKDDIDKVAHLGCNAYRISIEWSRIEPSPGVFDQDAIDHYVQIAQYCQLKNITLMCCLHHYSDPVWFMEQGGFAQDKNLKPFETYCQKMYEALCPYVEQWIVISQPVAYALKGYKVGMQPPFLKDSGLENTVMLNMFKAHMAVYDMMHTAFKQTGQGLKPQVGLCHQIVQMKPSNSLNPLEYLVTFFADRLSNQTLLRTFTDGHFQSLIPGIDIAYLPQASEKFDFFALSYYSPLAFTNTTPHGPACPDECKTSDPIRIIDKEGMYNAIVQAAKLGKPIYIVENGINPKSDEQRNLLLNSYLSAISQAINDGYDVRGYLHWTLMNNYEWCYVDAQGNINQNKPEFGLYQNRVIDDTTGQLRIDFTHHDAMLKPSGHYYKKIIAMQRKKVSLN